MLFELVRHKDVSGVSGTGVVAEGVQFSDGACALRWVCGKWHTDGNYPSIEAVIELHGHGENTEVRYVRAYTRGPGEAEQSSRRDGDAADASDSHGRSGAGVARSLRSVSGSRVH